MRKLDDGDCNIVYSAQRVQSCRECREAAPASSLGRASSAPLAASAPSASQRRVPAPRAGSQARQRLSGKRSARALEAAAPTRADAQPSRQPPAPDAGPPSRRQRGGRAIRRRDDGKPVLAALIAGSPHTTLASFTGVEATRQQRAAVRSSGAQGVEMVAGQVRALIARGYMGPLESGVKALIGEVGADAAKTGCKIERPRRSVGPPAAQSLKRPASASGLSVMARPAGAFLAELPVLSQRNFVQVRVWLGVGDMRSVLWPLSALDGLAGDAEGGSAAPENVDLALRVGSVRGLGGPPAR